MARGGATFLINYEKRDMGSLNSKVSDERMVCGKEILPEWFADRMTALLFHSGSAQAGAVIVAIMNGMTSSPHP